MFQLILLLLCWIFIALTYAGDKEGFSAHQIMKYSLLIGTPIWGLWEIARFLVEGYLSGKIP